MLLLSLLWKEFRYHANLQEVVLVWPKQLSTGKFHRSFDQGKTNPSSL